MWGYSLGIGSCVRVRRSDPRLGVGVVSHFVCWGQNRVLIQYQVPKQESGSSPWSGVRVGYQIDHSIVFRFGVGVGS